MSLGERFQQLCEFCDIFCVIFVIKNLAELKSKVLFDIETNGQVYCIALGPVTICISIGTI